MKLSLNSLFFPHDHKKDHFQPLDGLRGLAVLFVLLSHSGNEKVFFFKFLNFSETGKLGVYLFFVLSAYLLDRQIALALINKKADWNYWRIYLIRRFLRIYPLFIVALIVHYLLHLFVIPTVIDNPKDILMHIFLLKGENVFWSIPVEFKYYFLSPLIMLFCHYVLKWRPKSTFLFLCALIFATIIAQFIFKMSMINTLRYFPIFLTGTLLSIFEVLLPENAVGNKYKKNIELLGIGSLMIIIVCIPYYFKLITGREFDLGHYIFYLPFSLLWGMVLVASKYGTNYIQAFFKIKFLRFIGTISFSMYLFHMPMLHIVMANQNLPEMLKAPLFLIGSTFFATISYLLIERPLSKINFRKKNPIQDASEVKKKGCGT